MKDLYNENYKPLNKEIEEDTRPKRQPTEWEKVFGNYTSDKELITRMHRLL
jgi:hypothetical protein